MLNLLGGSEHHNHTTLSLRIFLRLVLDTMLDIGYDGCIDIVVVLTVGRISLRGSVENHGSQPYPTSGLALV